jgi:hypothetical protein
MLQDQQTRSCLTTSYYFDVRHVCSSTYAYIQPVDQALPRPLQRVLCNCILRYSSSAAVATCLLRSTLCPSHNPKR